MQVEQRTSNGRTIWFVAMKNAWTGGVTEKRFPDRNAAESWVRGEEERKREERRILAGAKASRISPNVTVKGLLKAYFDFAISEGVSRVQSGYHASHIVELFGSRRASGITTSDIQKFIEIQKLRGCSQITINRRVSILKTAMAWAAREGVFRENNLAGMQLPRAVPKKIEPPSPDELRKMLQVAPKHVFRTIMLGLYTGARVGPSELFRLRWEHVDMWNRIINLPCARKNHNIDTRIVPINEILMDYLPAWKNEDDRRSIPWIVHYGGNPLRSLGRAWHQTMEKAGITRNFRPYDLRHAYATYAIASGADIKTVAEIMGHTDASMILKTYQHVRPEQKRKAMELVPSIV